MELLQHKTHGAFEIGTQRTSSKKTDSRVIAEGHEHRRIRGIGLRACVYSLWSWL